MQIDMKKILGLMLVLFTSFTGWSQSDSTITGDVDVAANATKMLTAEHEYINGNMRKSLTLYREVLANDPGNYKAQLGEAECYYNLKKYPDAFKSLDKATKLKKGEERKELILFYAKCFHRTGELDKAIEKYNAYLKLEKPKSYEAEEAAKYIRECEFAKRKMERPADVTISNLGGAINSRLEEYAPSITSDGKFMVFTSRRDNTTSPPERMGKNIDERGDYKFYEDIYYSTKDSVTGEWSDCEKLPGGVNTNFHDAVLSIVPDGSMIYVYKNDGDNAGDIFFSKRGETKWREAERLPKSINTSYFEGSVSQTADGKRLYFISERMGGLGRGDIYFSEKSGSGWGKPTSMGPVINTPYDEKFVFIHPNGKTLFFASEGHLGMGSYDIFKTELVNGVWSKPINLGYPINTVNEESTFSLTADNKNMYIAAEYKDSYGDRDIYKIDVSRYALMSEGYEQSVYAQLIAIVVDVNGKAYKGVKISVEDLDTGEIQIGSTDKAGYCRVNVQGGKTYKVTAEKDEKKFTEDVSIELKKSGETIRKWEIRL
jgi:tetratricopeptide (TPR) repeat protein